MTIVYIGLDGYSDLWADCFSLLNTFWNDRPYRTLFVNNKKEVAYENVEILHAGKEAKWSKKVQLALEKIDKPCVCLLLEDYFVDSFVNTSAFQEALELMNKEDFNTLLMKNPSAIKYKGIVSSSDSVETLKDYDALLFLAKYKNEGLPGTIIDAYAAGIPVISAKWESFSDIVKEGLTRIDYMQNDLDGLEKTIRWATSNKQQLFRMKYNCTIKAKEFHRETVVTELFGKGFFN